jgi:hypothetical protein
MPTLIVSSAKAGEAARAIGVSAVATKSALPSLANSRLFMRFSPYDFCPRDCIAAQAACQLHSQRSQFLQVFGLAE